MSWIGDLLPASVRRELEIRRWRRSRARWDRPFRPVPVDADVAALSVHGSSRPVHLTGRLARGPLRAVARDPARGTTRRGLAADCVSGARLWSLVRGGPARSGSDSPPRPRLVTDRTARATD